MNKKTKMIVAGLGFAQLALLGIKTMAQESRDLKEVVISATKNEQKQFQTGKVVTIISREDLDRSGGKTLAQLLNQQVGITVGGVGSNASKEKSLFFRGAASAYTVILLDGVPITDPSGTGGAFDLRMLAVDQIDHIEILRGAQSTIYGSEAVAGVINIITKKTATIGNNVYGVATAGSYESFKGTLGLSSKVNIFSYNLSYSHYRTEGISEAISQTPGLSFDKDGTKQGALNANFGIQADEHLSINPFIRYMYGEFNYDDNAYTDAANVSNAKHFNGGLNSVYQLPTGKITLNYSFQKTNRAYVSAYPEMYQGKMHLFDVFYNQHYGKKINVMLGIDNRYTNVTYFGLEPTVPHANLFSSYASLFLHDLGLFNLELGGRYNKHNQYGQNFTYNITPSINFNKSIKLFGSVGSAFRAPTLDMLFGQYGANLGLKPETANNYELGTNIGLLQDRLSLRLVGFKRDMEDAIVYGSSGYINQDKEKTKGFEVELSRRWGNFSLAGYYAYVDGKQYNGSTISKSLLRRPKNTLGGNIAWILGPQLNLSMNYKFTGERTDTDFSVYPFENTTLGAYHLLDFYGEYRILNKKLRFFVDLKNLTNQKYTEIVGYSTMGTNLNAGLGFNFN